MASQILTAAKEAYWRAWYSYVSGRDKSSDIIFMNYGYQDDSKSQISLSSSEEKNRYAVQMYDHAASFIPNSIKNKQVLEIGCGRGGGAAFLRKYYQPISLKAIDLCPPAVEFCRSHYQIPGLEFFAGDAMEIPFKNSEFDAVVNIESSHRYSDMPKFLSEVKRVLKPKGYFSFADFRASDKIQKLRNDMEDSGLVIIKEEDITLGVLRALELDNQRKLELIQGLVPFFLHKPAREFASVVNSASYNSLKNRQREYFYFLLQKN